MASSKDPERGEDVVEGQPVYYGTFQGQPFGFPQQPATPPNQEQSYQYPAARGSYTYSSSTQGSNPKGPHGNYLSSSVQGIHSRIAEGRPLIGGQHYQRLDKLPFCNLGWGWFLFILGFGSVFPWCIGAVIFCCLAYDFRERAGLMACTIAALLVVIHLMILSSLEYWGEHCHLLCALR